MNSIGLEMTRRITCIQEFTQLSRPCGQSVLFGEFKYAVDYLPWTCICFHDKTGVIPCICVPMNWNVIRMNTLALIPSFTLIHTNEWDYLEIESMDIVYIQNSPHDYYIDLTQVSHLNPFKSQKSVELHSVKNTLAKWNSDTTASGNIQLQGRVLSKNELFQSRSRITFMIQLECFLEFESIPCPLTSFLLFDYTFDAKDKHDFASQLALLYYCIQVQDIMSFKRLIPTKINIHSREYKILFFKMSKSEFAFLNSSILESHTGLYYDLNQEIPTYIPTRHAENLICYTGKLTKILDLVFGIYELDNHYEFFASFHSFSCLGLRVGCTLTLMNVHLLKNDSNKASLVACHYSQISISKMSHEPCVQFHIGKNRKKNILSKYPNMQSLLLARRVKASLLLLDSFESESLTFLTREMTYALMSPCTASSHVLHPIHDFMMHKEQVCPILVNSELVEIIWTWKDIQGFYDSYQASETVKGYSVTICSPGDLVKSSFSEIVLIGNVELDSCGSYILSSNGSLKIWISFVSCTTTCPINTPCTETTNQGNTPKDLQNYILLLKKFQLVIETFGYMTQLVHKVYILVETDPSNAVWIKKNPKTTLNQLVPQDALLFKILYKRPITLDVVQLHSHIQYTCTLEGIVWKLDEFERPDRGRFGLVKLFGRALQVSIRPNEIYWISGSILMDEVDTLCISISQAEGLIEFKGSSIGFDFPFNSLTCLSVESLLTSTTAPPPIKESISVALPLKVNETPDTHINETKTPTSSIDREPIVFNLKGIVVSKSLCPSNSWKLEGSISPQQLSLEYNIGIGRLDRILLVKLVDEVNPSFKLDIFWDVRLLSLPLGILVGSRIQFNRLGYQISKSTGTLYGKTTLLTSVHVLQIGNGTIPSTIEPSLSTVLLNQVCDMLPQSINIIGNLISIKKLHFSIHQSCFARMDAHEGQEEDQVVEQAQELCVTATLRISDGSMDALADVDSPNLIYKILSLSCSQIKELSRQLKVNGGSLVYNDSQSNSSCPYLQSLVESVLGPQHILITCQKRFNPSLKVRSFKSKNICTSTFAYSPLLLKILDWKRVDDPFIILNEWNLFSL